MFGPPKKFGLIHEWFGPLTKKSVTTESLPNSFDQYFNHASVFMVLDQSMYQSIENPLSPSVFSIAAAAIATIASVPAFATVAATATPAIAAIPHCWSHHHRPLSPVVVAISDHV